ncbi:MAG: hypothetical protein ACKVJG_10660 [Candidatus Latescibacterota bacterium]|jgi:phosphosulfolactate phosphohydrolase-like enzyme
MSVYELKPDLLLAITFEGEQLFVQPTNGPKLLLHAESERTFFLSEIDAQIRFEKDENGKFTRCILHQNGEDQPAERQE